MVRVATRKVSSRELDSEEEVAEKTQHPPHPILTVFKGTRYFYTCMGKDTPRASCISNLLRQDFSKCSLGNNCIRFTWVPTSCLKTTILGTGAYTMLPGILTLRKGALRRFLPRTFHREQFILGANQKRCLQVLSWSYLLHSLHNQRSRNGFLHYLHFIISYSLCYNWCPLGTMHVQLLLLEEIQQLTNYKNYTKQHLIHFTIVPSNTLFSWTTGFYKSSSSDN